LTLLTTIDQLVLIFQYGKKQVGGLKHIPPGWDEWNGLVGDFYEGDVDTIANLFFIWYLE